MFLTFAGAALRNKFEWLTNQLFRKFTRIGNRCRCTDELRLAAVKLTNARQPPKQICHMASENSAVHVQLVEDDEFEILEQPRPLRVVREDALVQHVGIAQDDMSF